ncbi:MAG TPA: hypothetical protein VFQ39_17705, partial [Longimicrobium sp.]|nr:hypothetical protein [Longimicrobium sp.]
APADEEAEEEPAEDLPWMSTEVEPHPSADAGEDAGAVDAESAAPSGELMPWEVPFDLAEDAAEAPTTERAAPREEPVAREGSFSFEDFFSAPAEAPAPPAEPEPEAPAPVAEAEDDEDFPLPQEAPGTPVAEEPRASAPPPAGPAGEEDEDLESFQAWLQSLKR